MSRRPRRLFGPGALACALIASYLAAPAVAEAQSDETAAKTYYDAGVQAYSAGRFAVAVEAFSAAYDLAKKPTLLFSLAQAERRQYTVTRDPKTLRSAIAHYRKYLEEVKEGGRRTDAVEALGELEAVAARVDPASTPEPSDKPALTSRILVTTATKGATVFLDGAPHTESPLVEQVKPGAHTVRVTAPGFIDEERAVVTVEGTLLPVEITLRERPSFLSVGAPSGALVTIDGRAAGQSPLQGDLQVTGGSHVLTVTKPGRVPYQKSLFVAPGETVPVRVNLFVTPQRFVSYAVFAGGGAALLAGAAASLVALDAETTAKQVLSLASSSPIAQADLDRYNSALSRRDEGRVAALWLLGAGTALGLTGAALYLFDNAEPPPRRDPNEATRMAFSFTVTPTSAGVGITGSF